MLVLKLTKGNVILFGPKIEKFPETRSSGVRICWTTNCTTIDSNKIKKE
jgi:hypothetical protein